MLEEFGGQHCISLTGRMAERDWALALIFMTDNRSAILALLVSLKNSRLEESARKLLTADLMLTHRGKGRSSLLLPPSSISNLSLLCNDTITCSRAFSIDLQQMSRRWQPGREEWNNAQLQQMIRRVNSQLSPMPVVSNTSLLLAILQPRIVLALA